MNCRWGCDHEKVAVSRYQAESQHADLSIKESGLFIDEDRPYIGATPECSCCPEIGILEVKCPFCVRDGFDNNAFCMTFEEGSWTLKKDHAYHYQVQTQLTYAKYSTAILWFGQKRRVYLSSELNQMNNS